MIDNLIIIIPTYNRQDYLRRVINYYSSFPCKVYICDSSKDKADVESIGNIIYRWVPQSNFYSKILDVLNESPADFYALSADDDFLKQETLKECYEQLCIEKNYALANGVQFLFKKDYDEKLYYNSRANGFMDVKKIVNNSEGISYYWKNYQNMLWSLFRKEVILKAFIILSKCEFKNGNFVELVLSIEALRNGSIYLSDAPFNFMEINPNEHWGNTTPSISWISYVRYKSLRNDIKNFKEIYRNDVLAKKCLRLHMGNPFIILFNHLSNKIKRAVVIFIKPCKYNTKSELGLKVVSDNIMLDRLSNVFAK